uniref:gliding motility protein GldB-related protein n=1 Tax=Flavobacterium psychrophilum TaxID=96345 RepID=UPI00293D776B|nr:hypothetical protein [Flavobacterium psychrophilum]
MKKYLILVLFLFAIISCSKKSEIQKKVAEIPVSIKVDRYDKAFFETPPSELPKLKLQYPEFFPPSISDSILVDKMTNPLWRELYAEVEKTLWEFR